SPAAWTSPTRSWRCSTSSGRSWVGRRRRRARLGLRRSSRLRSSPLRSWHRPTVRRRSRPRRRPAGTPTRTARRAFATTTAAPAPLIRHPDGVILVGGEALFDLVVAADGSLTAHPGGGPFNAARALGRLEQPVAYLGRLSSDRFGQILRRMLTGDGV